jgi:hypothetical protein
MALSHTGKTLLLKHRPGFREAEIMEEAGSANHYAALTTDKLWLASQRSFGGGPNVVMTGLLGVTPFELVGYDLTSLTKVSTRPGALLTSFDLEFGPIKQTATIENPKCGPWESLAVLLDGIVKENTSPKAPSPWKCSFCSMLSAPDALRCTSCGASRDEATTSPAKPPTRSSAAPATVTPLASAVVAPVAALALGAAASTAKPKAPPSAPTAAPPARVTAPKPPMSPGTKKAMKLAALGCGACTLGLLVLCVVLGFFVSRDARSKVDAASKALAEKRYADAERLANEALKVLHDDPEAKRIAVEAQAHLPRAASTPAPTAAASLSACLGASLKTFNEKYGTPSYDDGTGLSHRVRFSLSTGETLGLDILDEHDRVTHLSFKRPGDAWEVDAALHAVKSLIPPDARQLRTYRIPGEKGFDVVVFHSAALAAAIPDPAEYPGPYPGPRVTPGTFIVEVFADGVFFAPGENHD